MQNTFGKIEKFFKKYSSFNLKNAAIFDQIGDLLAFIQNKNLFLFIRKRDLKNYFR